MKTLGSRHRITQQKFKKQVAGHKTLLKASFYLIFIKFHDDEKIIHVIKIDQHRPYLRTEPKQTRWLRSPDTTNSKRKCESKFVYILNFRYYL